MTGSSDVFRVYSSRPVHTSNSGRRQDGWRRAGKFSKFVPPEALNMHSLAISVLRCLRKTFSKLLKFTLRNILLRG